MKRPSSPAPIAKAPPADQGSAPLPLWALFAGFLAAAFFIYYPVLHGEFLWDDAGHVTAPALQSWSGLGRIWFEPGATQQYYPLLHSVFWLEHAIWGDATVGYHMINILWHALSACLLVAVLRRLAVPGALLAGLFFLVHPVCVESVAWISEQKNTLSLVFYLTAVLAWLRFDEHRRPADYALATLWFAAALLTKTVTATLPAALLVVAWWRRGRLSWQNDVIPLLPWFALGIAGDVGLRLGRVEGRPPPRRVRLVELRAFLPAQSSARPVLLDAGIEPRVERGNRLRHGGAHLGVGIARRPCARDRPQGPHLVDRRHHLANDGAR